ALHPLHRIVIIFEEQCVAFERRRLCLVDVGDARWTGAQRRRTGRLEQLVDERLAMRRLLVLEASVLRRQRVVLRLAAMSADLDRAGTLELELQLGEG